MLLGPWSVIQRLIRRCIGNGTAKKHCGFTRREGRVALHITPTA